MNIYENHDMAALLSSNSYVGRGIAAGNTPDGKKAVCVYFIMGRSANSRNRVFALKNGTLFTEPFDPALVKDPSLIIYAALRRFENRLIVTNGDQTDTVFDFLQKGKTFYEALETRCFEPDAPNFTPRISAMLTFANGDFTNDFSILKSADAAGSACVRQGFSYPSLPGTGHFLHTYVCNGEPIPSFVGEPERITVGQDIDAWSKSIWDALDQDNKISLYVRYIDLKTGEAEDRLFNKNRK